jgi:hypothetical protein
MPENDIENIADEIRRFAETVDNPDDWMVVVPVDDFGDVKDALDTTKQNLSTSYQGIPLCYGDGYDETKVKLNTNLSDYLRSIDTDTDRSGGGDE